MARARLLKPGFFANDKLAEMHPHARLLFAGLWTLADREGRLPDRPLWIKGSVFPYENVPVEKYLHGLDERDFILRYETDEGKFIQIRQFLKHQTPHIKEQASTIPAPDEHSASTAFSRTSPAVPIAVPKTVPIAEAVTPQSEAGAHSSVHPDLDLSDETGFALEYIHRYEQKHAAPPSPNEKAAARALERDFGSETCMQIAADHDWEMHPNWLRRALSDPNRGRKLQAAGRSTGRRQNSGDDIAAAWEDYERRQRES